jgi:hypothetical protein
LLSTHECESGGLGNGLEAVPEGDLGGSLAQYGSLQPVAVGGHGLPALGDVRIPKDFKYNHGFEKCQEKLKVAWRNFKLRGRK